MQGYNAQAATNEQQIVIAAELTNSSADFGQIEPVFADTKIDRFQHRGRAACRSEWRLITATHNLLKLWRATTPAAIA